MKPIEPKTVPQLARSLAKWTRNNGALMWSTKSLHGTRYFAPPSMPPIVREAGGFMVNPGTGNSIPVPTDAMMNSHRALATYYAENLEKAKYFHLDDIMTNLALRTQMSKYKATLEMLRIGPNKELAPWGFITWAIPIGQAEQHKRVEDMVDFRSGEAEARMEKFNPYEDADFPVVAASWRYEPEANSLWVAFYTQHDDHLRIQARQGASPEELKKLKQHMEPLALEREQELPLNRALNWCDADPANGPRLEMTGRLDPDEADGLVREARIQNNAAAEIFVSDWVRILLSSWMIMKWKVAEREVIPAPPSVARTVAKETGRSKQEAAQEAGTTVVRLGAPIRKRGTASTPGTKKGAWKVRALVGPVVRDRQYIPAWDTYDEEPRFIEPFWMGPEDAPISNLDRVFVLGDD